MTPKLSILIAAHNVAPYIEKTLDSIPRREDIEIVVRSNGSTDSTPAVLINYRDTHPDLKVLTLITEDDQGAAHNFNSLLKFATGEYIQFIDGDDYLYPDKYEHIIARMNGEDCIYMDLVVNSGDVWKLTPDSRVFFCAPFTRALRREFIEGLKFPENRITDCDWFFNQELLKRDPVSVFTGIPAYHYNHPRAGSLMDLKSKGIIKERD